MEWGLCWGWLYWVGVHGSVGLCMVTLDYTLNKHTICIYICMCLTLSRAHTPKNTQFIREDDSEVTKEVTKAGLRWLV